MTENTTFRTAKPSRPWFKKKRFLLPLILLIIFIIATASGGKKDTAAGTAPATPGPTSTTFAAAKSAMATPAPEEAAPAFPGTKKGDVVGQAGAALKVGDATVTSTPITNGDAMFGKTICTTVTMSNGSKDTVSFNSWDWKLQAPSGTIGNSTYSGSKNILSGGQIAPGGKATGDVCFDNKNAEAGQFIVLYEPTFAFFSDRAAWINTL